MVEACAASRPEPQSEGREPRAEREPVRRNAPEQGTPHALCSTPQTLFAPFPSALPSRADSSTSRANSQTAVDLGVCGSRASRSPPSLPTGTTRVRSLSRACRPCEMPQDAASQGDRLLTSRRSAVRSRHRPLGLRRNASTISTARSQHCPPARASKAGAIAGPLVANRFVGVTW
jgi:hypothetical protein